MCENERKITKPTIPFSILFAQKFREKLEGLVKKEFPNYKLRRDVSDNGGWIESGMSEYEKDETGAEVKVDTNILRLSQYIDYYFRSKENNGSNISDTKSICKDIVKQAKKLQKKVDGVAINTSITFGGFMWNTFSDPSKLINKKSSLKMKHPFDLEKTSFVGTNFINVLNSYAEIEKTPEKILILTQFVISDLIECFNRINNKFVAMKGQKSKPMDIRPSIIITLGNIYYESTGEIPNIKRSGDGFSKKDKFSRFLSDFSEEFGVMFDIKKSQEIIRNNKFFEKSTPEEIVEDLNYVIKLLDSERFI